MRPVWKDKAMARQTRISVLLLLMATLIVLTAGSPLLRAQTPEESEILNAVNAARTRRGLAPLHWDKALASAAQAHADLMVQQKTLSHRYPGEPSLATRGARHGALFSTIAENIAMDISPQHIVNQWLKSPPHLENILNPKLDAAGVGLAKRGEYYFGVMDFSDAVEALTHAEVEQKVGAMLLREGIQPTGPARDARQTCEMPSGTAGGSKPRFVIRWESPNLNSLPPALQAAIHSGQYHTAAVGACDSMHPQQDFATYRVAVLLY